jgi:prepilin-type N-terminal cleavage/methylation domain-containing protein/prepilin-type processing-associated H-X9-DG protein
MASVPSRGLTLVELLVVLAIVGLVVSLAVPALSRAIARGQVTKCTNNQYQIAFALLRYDDKQGKLPGWLNYSPNDDPDNPAKPACTWTVPMLPFLGRSDIYDSWPQLPNNSTIDTLICPSNRPGRGVEYPAVAYAANAGAGGTDGDDGVFVDIFTKFPATTPGSTAPPKPLTPVSLDVIADADGTSTTLAFAEKAALGFQPHNWAHQPAAAPQGSPFGPPRTPSPNAVLPTLPPIFGVATPPVPFPILNTGSTQHFAPASTHDGGVVVAFCDGHTAFLGNKLQPYEYAQLLTRRSRWQGATNKTNSSAMQPWLLRNGQPYLLDEKILRP